MQGFSDHLLVVNNSTREDAFHDWLRHAAARNQSRVADSVRNWGVHTHLQCQELRVLPGFPNTQT